MVGKNLLTVLIVVVVLFGAFLGYQHVMNKKDLETHHQGTYSRMTKAAKISPRAGMNQMGWALKKYYAENKSYPSSLDALYPKYIPGKSFISDVNWDYRPGDNNYLLSKRTTVKGRTMMASMDKGLRVRLGTSTKVAMVVKQPETVSAAAKSAPTPASKAGTAPKIAAKDIPATAHPPVGTSPKIKAPSGKTEKAETRATALQSGKKKPAKKKIVTFESETEMDVVAANFSGRFLVWKNRDGTVGFGNNQYPAGGDIEYISVGGVWYKATR